MIDTPMPAPEEGHEMRTDPVATNIAAAHGQLVETTRRSPYLSVAAALGFGVVLGGGVPTWVIRLATGSVVRLFAAQIVHTMFTPVEDHPEG